VLKFVQVLGFVQIGVLILVGFSTLGVQVGVFRLGRFVNSGFPFFASPPRQGDPLGEVCI
jgi:hypothetical protein